MLYKTDICDLPDELIEHIFSFLDAKGLKSAKRVSKRFRCFSDELLPADDESLLRLWRASVDRDAILREWKQKGSTAEVLKGYLNSFSRHSASYLYSCSFHSSLELFFAEEDETFFDDLDFRGLDVDEAMRFVLTEFKLPNRRVSLEQFLTAFSRRFSEHCTGVLSDMNVIYRLLCSGIMLSADAHSMRITQKMSLEKWLQIMRESEEENSGGAPLPRDMLVRMYERIVRTPMWTFRNSFGGGGGKTAGGAGVCANCCCAML